MSKLQKSRPIGVNLMIACFCVVIISQLFFTDSISDIWLLVPVVVLFGYLIFGFLKGKNLSRILSQALIVLLLVVGLIFLGVHLFLPEYSKNIPKENYIPMIFDSLLRLVPLVVALMYLNMKEARNYFSQ